MSGSVDEQAQQARDLMTNPLFAQCLAELDSDAVRVWRTATNTEQREAAWYLMIAIQQLGARIKSRLESKMLNDAARRHAR